MRARSVLALLALSSACTATRRAPEIGPLPFAVDTVRTQTIADGVTQRFLFAPSGPWRIHVLDVDLDRCNALVAAKGSDSVAGRIRTTTILGRLAEHAQVIGGVNADFFSLKTGVPVNVLVVDGRMLTPPVNRPVLAIDSMGIPHIAFFRLADGGLRPFQPRYAVGGQPEIVRDSVVLATVDSVGNRAFNVGRNPRTAAGIARDGHRVILVVVDGRRKAFSDGMSLRELANLMLELGARDAINLDGGGSSTMVYADPNANGKLTLANSPSDKEGERAVGDALAVVKACR